MRRLAFFSLLFTASLQVSLAEEAVADAVQAGAGKAIYAKHCASCHGDKGEGVDEEYDEPLWGNRSLDSLTRYIHKSMPEDEEELVIDEDAAAVARYVYDAFYSPAAQARNRPPRVELLRLSNTQYRQSVADLAGLRNEQPTIAPERGLIARYHNSEKMAKEKEFVVERVDPQIDFDFGGKAPVEGMNQQAFSIRWTGSLLPPRSGDYDIRIRTHNGALLHLNTFDRGGNDDAFIDAYVSTNNTLQEKTAKMFLLGGRAYPIHLQYFSYEEERSSIHLEWKPPHGAWEAIPTDYLSPQRVPPVTVVQANFAPDDRSLGFERGSRVSKEWQEATTFAAIDITNHIISNLRQITGLGRDEVKQRDPLQKFAHEFAEAAFRRPLTDEQRELIVDSRFEEQENPETALKHSILLALTSPHFLYPELVAKEGEPDGYAIAGRLALYLWDSLPDAELRRAAAEERLETPEQVSAQANRMLKDPRTRTKIRGFFEHWLALDEREDLSKDPELYPEFDEHVIADLRTSLERFVDDVVWSEASDYRHLLLADYIYLNDRLSYFYETGEGPPEPSFSKVYLRDRKRSGIFTHPYLLSANAYHDNTSPIHRGVFLSKNVLGRLLKPPPEAVAFENEDFDPSLTMREKVTELTKKESCMQCHRVINPIGFSLENYDAVGRFRTVDNNKPIDTVSDYVDDRDKKVQVADARDLAEIAIGSEAAHRAFITHLFHHLTKQTVTAYGPDALDALREKFVESGYNIQRLIVAIASGAATFHESAAESESVTDTN